MEETRALVAELFQMAESWVTFTSGATESIEIIASRLTDRGVDTFSSPINHSAVLRCARSDEQTSGNRACYFNHVVNNETGIIYQARKDVLLCVNDASQAIAKVERPTEFGDFVVGSAHKFHGPVGVGFLVIRNSDHVELLQRKGYSHAQERGIRPGTLNAPAIIQTGEVAKWMLKNGDEYRAKLKHLQSTFESKIKSLTDCWIIGADQERAPHITSLNLPGVDNEALIAAVNDRLAIASGSACASEKVEPSHVLMAMFNNREIADTTVRISYGWFNTEAEVLEAAEIIAKAAETIRSFSL